MTTKYQITVGTYNPYKIELVHSVTFIQQNKWGGDSTPFTSAGDADPLHLSPAHYPETYAKHFVWDLWWEKAFTMTIPYDPQANKFYRDKYDSRQPIKSIYVQAWVDERLKAEKQIYNMLVKLPLTHGPGTTIVKLEGQMQRRY